MNDTERKQIIAILERGEMLPSDWSSVLFPNQKRECELVYDGKAREGDILAETMSVPLQKTRMFGNNGDGWHNQLIFGDNLQIMKSLLDDKRSGKLCNADGTPGIRLVYIDPPFSTRREMKGTDGTKAYQDKLAAGEFLEFLRKRLILIRELLSDDGSVYVHLDWRMNAYVRVLMDEVFGKEKFRNEIVWSYRRWPGKAQRYQNMHDMLMFYTKGSNYIWNQPTEPKAEGTPSYKRWNVVNPDGSLTTHYDKSVTATETAMRDVWSLSWLQSNSKERVEYPTQKPEALLARVIKTSSNEGDLVADFFLGSGTTTAVAEKLGRRWIGTDCGKLAIYTTQKRMLNLKKEIGNKGKQLRVKPFALMNAGLYELDDLVNLPGEEWKEFAMRLFECRKDPHTIAGIRMDGKRRGKSVLVYSPDKLNNSCITEETIQKLHANIGRMVGDRMFLIAPDLSFGFLQDYVDLGTVRYYALRVPYSIIHELHRRDFSALRQPDNESDVNDTVDSVGFDFNHPPKVEYSTGHKKIKGTSSGSAFIKITTFESSSPIYEKPVAGDCRETLSMVMIDYNYNREKPVFNFDEVFYGGDLKGSDWAINFEYEKITASSHVMAIFVDIYGNEARELIAAKKFKTSKPAVKKSRRTMPGKKQ